jgi:hypothetical protein
LDILVSLPVHGRELGAACKLLLELLSDVYAIALRDHPLPPLYQCNLVYRPEPRVETGEGPEDWTDPWTAYERGWIDCDDACLWRLAELKARGVQATAQIVRQVNPDTGKFHCRVRLPDGRVEDPALLFVQQKGV